MAKGPRTIWQPQNFAAYGGWTSRLSARYGRAIVASLTDRQGKGYTLGGKLDDLFAHGGVRSAKVTIDVAGWSRTVNVRAHGYPMGNILATDPEAPLVVLDRIWIAPTGVEDADGFLHTGSGFNLHLSRLPDRIWVGYLGSVGTTLGDWLGNWYYYSWNQRTIAEPRADEFVVEFNSLGVHDGQAIATAKVTIRIGGPWYDNIEEFEKPGHVPFDPLDG